MASKKKIENNENASVSNTTERITKKSIKQKKNERRSFKNVPWLLEIKPKEKYIFHSDYFEIDGGVACIMSYFHNQGSEDGYGPFWGINKIPGGMPQDVTVIVFEQARRMGERWLIEHQNQAENIASKNQAEQEKGGTASTKATSHRNAADLVVIANELQNGASYLNVHWRIMIKAPDIVTLDETIKKIDRQYIDRFGNISIAAYMGDQKKELSRLFMKNMTKEGDGYYFTSTEYAGSYNLVTHGLEDVDGEYIGYMVGDVNNSAVLFNVDKYKHHVVIANEGYAENMYRIHMSDLWGSKISQSALLNDHRVVHLILDGVDLDKLGPKFDKLTYRIDMNTGDINMFEMFGEEENELAIFPSQMQKLVLMAEQAYETTDNDRSIIRSSLEDVATTFYIEQGMWRENAVAHRDRLRVVNIPHEQVPKLEVFVSYLDTEYKHLVNSSARDDEKLHAFSVLSATFKNLLSNNGDLFNTITTDKIDGAKTGRRVIYDFSKLMIRGKGIAMAQLVNVVGFAVGNLGEGDTVIIHGTEQITNRVKDYILNQFEMLYDKGGRVVYLYNNIDRMLKDAQFSEFDKADYTILGYMTDNIVSDYQKALGQVIPGDLVRLVTTKSEQMNYIRRGFDNVVFHADLSLGIRSEKERMMRR